ncbi:MAG: Asr2172 protein [uncultured Sulfurovum sp.]|uniref:Asr2172 protein n=1 Tax=uncultured Sulfurovum sp. TaxID=269237 RepID=A0A6S6TDK8_9BACT|nr:MAG: Asr2172 protein [uncultured Sulfurovum sp.]
MKDLLERITIDPEICHGKPSIRGLRYPVEMILQLMSSGMSVEEILEDYEDLEKEDVMAVLLYASKLTEVKSIYKLDVA